MREIALGFVSHCISNGFVMIKGHDSFAKNELKAILF